MIVAITEWSWHVISIAACWHSVKFCPHAAPAFRSQQPTKGNYFCVMSKYNPPNAWSGSATKPVTVVILTLSVRESPRSCRALQSYNSPGDWARELCKPSADSESLAVKIEKKMFFVFGGGFLDVTSQRGHALVILATFAWPWAQTYWTTLLAQSFVKN